MYKCIRCHKSNIAEPDDLMCGECCAALGESRVNSFYLTLQMAMSVEEVDSLCGVVRKEYLNERDA